MMLSWRKWAVPSSTGAASARVVEPVATAVSIPRRALTLRAWIIGILCVVLVDLWIHWAELVLGQRGHTALANTSIPVGAFNALVALVVVNILLQRVAHRWALTARELLVIYVMMTVSTVLSSSGALHFIVPSVTAAFYYASAENRWAELFHRYIPDWLAQKDAFALKYFYQGNAPVPLGLWWKQIGAWTLFMTVYTFTCLCLMAIMRRQWVERERLTFPTVALPLALIREPQSLFSSQLLWLGFAIPFALGTLNTIHLNYPAVPEIPLRATSRLDIAQWVTTPPWNAIGYMPMSFYPFVIGIAYLLSLEVTFSCWFFYMVTKAELVLGAAMGWTAAAGGAAQSVYPWIGHQGAGAFLGLTAISLHLARRHLREVWQTAWQGRGDDSMEPLPYRWAVLGFFLGLLGSIVFCALAGMSWGTAAVLVLLALSYMMAATRTRAESGNAWLFGPGVDVYQLMTTTFGTTGFRAQDLTILAYMRAPLANFDLRCISMPHQLDGFKMGGELRTNLRQLVVAMMSAIALGFVISFVIALAIWYQFGAGAKAEPWRTYMGRTPFDALADALKTPLKPDTNGTIAVVFGFLITVVLAVLRTQLSWFPFHPVGYAIAQTFTMQQVWLPFIIAWAVKWVILHFGGMKLYRQSLPFFFGLILGDFLNGGFWTLVGCLTDISVYPINW